MYRVHRVLGLSSLREAAERQLAGKNILLPFAQRAEWLRLLGYRNAILLIAADAITQQPHAAASIAVGRSRSLPGHHIYKVERFGAGRSATADDELLNAIAEVARSDRLCIRARVELFERDSALRQRLARTLKELGFVRTMTPASYVCTPCLDLSPPESVLFAKISPSARRNVRAPMKRGFEVTALDDSIYVERLEALMGEVYRRTGGKARRLPWEGIVGLSRVTPNHSRLVGLHAPNDRSPTGLVSFAWGCVNGSYATYEAGASTRHHGWGNLAVAYAPVWDLVAWAKREGAAWFDFGGVPAHTDTAAVAGIADFKRFFTGRIVEVGEQWILEPRPIRAMIARSVSAAFQQSRRTLAKYLSRPADDLSPHPC